MAISNKELGFIVTGVAIAVILGYVGYLSVNVETYPDIEIAARGGINEPLTPFVNNRANYSVSSNSLVPLVNSPHRYPNVTGGNFSALIHHGLSALNKRAPSDDKWIECPPANVMW